MKYDFNRCRFCKQVFGRDFHIKYGVRHYAHGSCLLDAKGEKVLGILHPRQLGQLPALKLREMGLLDKVVEKLRGEIGQF